MYLHVREGTLLRGMNEWINANELHVHQSFEGDLSMNGLMSRCQGWQEATGSLGLA